jgi:hypothetical protein
MCPDLLERDREADDASDQREVAQAERVARERTHALWRRCRIEVLEGILQPTEIGPPEQAGDEDGRSRSCCECRGSLVVRHGCPGHDE